MDQKENNRTIDGFPSSEVDQTVPLTPEPKKSDSALSHDDTYRNGTTNSAKAPTVSWESMPLPPQYAQPKKRSIGLIATLTGISLCLIGAVMGFTPMVLAGGPLNLAYESGYRDPEYVDASFTADQARNITFSNNVDGMTRRVAHDITGEKGDYRATDKLLDGIYHNRIELKESSDDKVHIRYYENPNKLASQFRHIELKDGTVVVSPVLEIAPDWINLTNLYLIYADYISSYPRHTGQITVELPVGWDGTITLSKGCQLAVRDMTFKGQFAASEQDVISRLEFENANIVHDVVLDSENIKAIQSNFDGTLDISSLIDRNSVYISDSTAKSMSLSGDGNMTIIKPHTSALNVFTAKGKIIGLLEGSPQDYNLDLSAYIMTDFIQTERDTDTENESSPSRQRDILHMHTNDGVHYSFPVNHPLLKDAASELLTDRSVLDSSRSRKDFIDQKILPLVAFKQTSQSATSGAPTVTLSTSQSSLNVGFLGNDEVLGYSKPQKGAQAYYNFLLKKQSDQGVNTLPRSYFVNLSKVPQGAQVIDFEDILEDSRG